jgi:hypothetical protein
MTGSFPGETVERTLAVGTKGPDVVPVSDAVWRERRE